MNAHTKQKLLVDSMNDVIVAKALPRIQKSMETVTPSRREGYRIIQAMTIGRPTRVDKLATNANVSLQRVIGHLNHETGRGRVEKVAGEKYISVKARRSTAFSQQPDTKGNQFRGDLPGHPKYVEKAVQKVVVNMYERDRKARKTCLRVLGHRCHVCKMAFDERYGEIGIDFIEVHHRKPRFLTKTAYQLDPIKDLVPVCANCHAMLHYGRPWDSPRSVEELPKLLRCPGQ